MRPVMILAATITLASGCARQSVPIHSTLPTDRPLDVELYHSELANLRYFVSEPAHIAVFEVMAPPDGRVFLLYRTTSVPSEPGLNTVRSGRERLGIFYPQPPRNARPTVPPQRYLYIVASKSPLRVDFDNADLRRVYIAQRASPPANIGAALEQLNHTVGVDEDDEAWSADLFVL